MRRALFLPQELRRGRVVRRDKVRRDKAQMRGGARAGEQSEARVAFDLGVLYRQSGSGPWQRAEVMQH